MYTVGSQSLPMLWSQIPNVGVVSDLTDTSKHPQHGIGSHLALYPSHIRGSPEGWRIRSQIEGPQRLGRDGFDLELKAGDV